MQDVENERFRLIQDGQPVAWVEGNSAVAEILHYAAVYAQDGPVTIQKKVNGRWKLWKETPMTNDKDSAVRQANREWEVSDFYDDREMANWARAWGVDLLEAATTGQPTQSDALLTKLLKECLVKLRDVQGTEAPKQYACNLIKRIERVLQEQGK